MLDERKLLVFLVADHDYYAAYDAEHALKLAYEQTGCDATDFDLDDVAQVSGEVLDQPQPELDEDEQPTGAWGSIRKWLGDMTEPGWLCGED